MTGGGRKDREMKNPDFIVCSGTSNPALAAAVAAELGVRPAVRTATRFPDGEVEVRLDEPVRGREVILIQSTAPPVNDNLMELLTLVDACRRSAAARITAVVPYFGYARADKRRGRREPITASLVAQLVQAAGIDHLVTVDLHAAQIEGFFHIPVDSLTAVPMLRQAVRDRLPQGAVVVSPDTGRVAMAADYAQRLGCPVAILHKRRASGTETAVTHVVGQVRDRPCLIIDDMISTGGTIARAVEALLAAGARPEIFVAATHGLFVGEAWGALGHEAIREVFVTDSVVPAQSDGRLHVVSIAPLIAAAIRRIFAGESLSDLYHDVPGEHAAGTA
jgi:ribose-phosphate pyrophosphokinase